MTDGLYLTTIGILVMGGGYAVACIIVPPPWLIALERWRRSKRCPCYESGRIVHGLGVCQPCLDEWREMSAPLPIDVRLGLGPIQVRGEPD